MALIVQKFGGTSVANIERIRNVANKVKHELSLGNKVAVVVSAMSGVTNQLVGYVNELSPLHTQEAWSDPDIRKMYFEAIKWVLGMTEGSTASHPKP